MKGEQIAGDTDDTTQISFVQDKGRQPDDSDRPNRLEDGQKQQVTT